MDDIRSDKVDKQLNQKAHTMIGLTSSGDFVSILARAARIVDRTAVGLVEIISDGDKSIKFLEK